MIAMTTEVMAAMMASIVPPIAEMIEPCYTDRAVRKHSSPPQI
jgi:hypothetical protein